MFGNAALLSIDMKKAGACDFGLHFRVSNNLNSGFIVAPGVHFQLPAVWQLDHGWLLAFNCRDQHVEGISLQLPLSQREFPKTLLTL
jgi:hypothetical protein